MVRRKGVHIARLRGGTWLVSVLAAGVAVLIALILVLVKYELGH